MNYQWYPGHMTKAKRMMQENIRLIDLVIELVDARIPISSRNPDIDELGKNKARLILLNKADLADERCNKEWIAYFTEKGFHVLEMNARTGAGIKNVQGADVFYVRLDIGHCHRRRGDCYSEKTVIHFHNYPSITSSTIISTKPAAKPMVPRLEWRPCAVIGRSSSTTTNIIAPAPKARR